MTRKVKEILKLVTGSRYYSIELSENTCNYMCYSLNYAKNAGLITENEKSSCIKSINKYLTKMYTYAKENTPPQPELKEALELNDLPCEFKDTLEIYLNWKNRPKPWKRNENCSDC